MQRFNRRICRANEVENNEEGALKFGAGQTQGIENNSQPCKMHCISRHCVMQTQGIDDIENNEEGGHLRGQRARNS